MYSLRISDMNAIILAIFTTYTTPPTHLEPPHHTLNSYLFLFQSHTKSNY